MGRSRGGLTTKIHAIVDAMGLPIDLVLSEGQAYDGHYAHELFKHLQPGTIVLADRAYDANAIRTAISDRGARANIPAMPHRLVKPPFCKALYRERNLVERFFNKLKHFRAISTRYDKRDDNYLASIKLASLRIWIKYNESVT